MSAATDIPPAGLPTMLRRGGLSRALARPRLGAALAGAILGRRGCYRKFGDVHASTFAAGRQWRLWRGLHEVEGSGLVALAALLFDVSHGEAALAIFEAAASVRLDPEASSALSRVVDEWVARGSLSRREGA